MSPKFSYKYAIACPQCKRPVPCTESGDSSEVCPWCSIKIVGSTTPEKPRLKVIRRVGVSKSHSIHLPEELDEKIASERIQRILPVARAPIAAREA